MPVNIILIVGYFIYHLYFSGSNYLTSQFLNTTLITLFPPRLLHHHGRHRHLLFFCDLPISFIFTHGKTFSASPNTETPLFTSTGHLLDSFCISSFCVFRCNFSVWFSWKREENCEIGR